MKIKGEQKELAAERGELEGTLKSKARLVKLIEEELATTAGKHGDARRTAIVEREAAQAIDESELVTSEPVTVVLSERGWARAAKGHEIDVLGLSYKIGRPVPRRGARQEQSARRVHRQHRPSVQRRRAHPAICPRSGRAVGGSLQSAGWRELRGPC